jgi:hypothetical protein
MLEEQRDNKPAEATMRGAMALPALANTWATHAVTLFDTVHANGQHTAYPVTREWPLVRFL